MIDDPPEVAVVFPELREGIAADYSDEDERVLPRPDGSEVDTWWANYPYRRRMSRPEYDQTKRLLQIELLKLHTEWPKQASGFIEHIDPRGARVVALGKPTEREECEWYFQRYVHQRMPSTWFGRFERPEIDALLGASSARSP